MLYGIFNSAVLAAVKIISGIAGNSYALIADGIESMMDIVSSLVVLGSLRIAALPQTKGILTGTVKLSR